GLLLPVIAVMHVRHAAVRQSGTLLGTIAGGVAVAAGIASTAAGGLRMPALFVRGVGGGASGELWGEAGVRPRPLGALTMGLAVVAFAAAVLSQPLKLDIAWIFERVALGAWTLLVAIALWRSR